MEILTEEQCWEYLTVNQLGRVATVVSDHVEIFPVNYVTYDGEIYFKTAEGTKLAAITAHREVGFEIDGHDEATNVAWSVIVNGVARELSHDAELDLAESLPLFPWNLEPKNHYVAIDPTRVSGRRFVAEGRQ